MPRCECMFKDEMYCHCLGKPSNASQTATEALGRLLHSDLVHSHPSPTKMAVGSLWELYNGGQLEILANVGMGRFPIIGRFRTPERMIWRQGMWDMMGQFQNHQSITNPFNIKKRWTKWETPKGFSWHLHRQEDNLQEWWSSFPMKDGKEYDPEKYVVKLIPTPSVYPRQFKNTVSGKWEVLNETSEKANELMLDARAGEGWAWQGIADPRVTYIVDDTEGYLAIPKAKAFRITWKEKK
jgi:hypothetical protein